MVKFLTHPRQQELIIGKFSIGWIYRVVDKPEYAQFHFIELFLHETKENHKHGHFDHISLNFGILNFCVYARIYK